MSFIVLERGDRVKLVQPLAESIENSETEADRIEDEDPASAENLRRKAVFLNNLNLGDILEVTEEQDCNDLESVKIYGQGGYSYYIPTDCIELFVDNT